MDQTHLLKMKMNKPISKKITATESKHHRQGCRRPPESRSDPPDHLAAVALPIPELDLSLKTEKSQGG
jgi:hypothetical protein